MLANNGTSPKVVACSFSYSGLGVTCENHGSTLVMRSKDLGTSKNKFLTHCYVSVGTYSVPVHYSQIEYAAHSPGNPRIGAIFRQLLVIFFLLW